MKKRIVAMLLAAISVCSCGGMAACGGGQSQEPPKTYYLLNGFEDYREFLEFDYDGKYSTASTYFGDILLNKNEEYITEGTASMYYEVCEIQRYPDQYMTSTFLIPTKNKSGNFSDFSKVKSFSLDVYNASETEMDLNVSPAKILGKTWATQLRYQMQYTNYVLPAKAWTSITYTVDCDAIDMSLGGTNIGWIAINLGGVNAAVYLDNLVIKTTAEEYTPTECVLDKNEVCSFEKEYQRLVAFPYGNGAVEITAEINTDRNYSVLGNSLKVTIPSNTMTSGYGTVKLSNKLIAAASLGSYAEGAIFAFDVKKDYDAVQWIIPTFRNSYWGTRTEVRGVNIPAGRNWYTVEIPLNEVVSSPDGFELVFPIATKTDKVLYFDNFRVIA